MNIAQSLKHSHTTRASQQLHLVLVCSWMNMHHNPCKHFFCFFGRQTGVTMEMLERITAALQKSPHVVDVTIDSLWIRIMHFSQNLTASYQWNRMPNRRSWSGWKHLQHAGQPRVPHHYARTGKLWLGVGGHQRFITETWQESVNDIYQPGSQQYWQHWCKVSWTGALKQQYRRFT